jgi:putative oxidoreductase
MQFNDNGASIGKLVLRLAVAILMSFHGISKLRHGVAWMAGPLQAHHLPAWLAYGVYVAEVAAPILLIAGILTRPAALVIVFEMMMAIFLVLGPKAFDIDRQTGALRGELQLLYLFGALAIAFLGSGPLALSRGRGRWD